jgi:hypothetical protein
MFSNNLLMAASSISGAAYEVAYSCRFNADDSAHLLRTDGDTGTPKTHTHFIYFKRGNLSSLMQPMACDNGSDTNSFTIMFTAENKLQIYFQDTSATTTIDWISTQVFRDPHAWYFIVLTINTVPSTPILKVWNWNVEITEWNKTAANSLAQNDVFEPGTSGFRYEYGSYENGAGRFYDGYMALAGYMDGVVITDPVTDGLIEVDSSGVARPADVTGLDYGTAGHLLDFADDSDLGNDISGNNNDFTSSGLAANDQVVDTPTNNYMVQTPLWSNENFTLSNGNLRVTGSGGAVQGKTTSSFSIPTTGKWYFEATFPNAGMDVIGVSAVRQLTPEPGGDTDATSGSTASWAFNVGNEDAYTNDTATSYGSTAFVDSDVFNCAIDTGAGKIWFGKNGTYYNSGDPGAGTGEIYSGLTGELYVASRPWISSSHELNFGQKGFDNTVPTDFLALNTTNMAVPSIADGSANFQPNKRTGDGAGATANVNGATSSTTTLVVDGNSGTIVAGMYVTGTGISGSVTVASLSDQNNLVLSSAQSLSNDVALTFSSAVTQTGNSQFGTDLIIIKNRDETDEWKVVDSVRGATYEINTDSTNAQTQDTNGVTAFSATDGYMIGTGAGGYNDNTEKFIDYHFQEGSTPGMGINASVSHTQGSETTIAHGMSAVPVFALLKETDAATAWWVYHQSLTSKTNNYLVLDTDAGEATISSVWGTQSSTNFVIGDAASGVASGTYVCYSFAEVTGFSSFGKYEGTGVTNGTLVITGFKPALVICKSIDSTSNWFCYDSEREGYNVDNDSLYMDTVDDENTADEIDLLSNGFKLRIATDPNVEETYIYAAWAENPFGGHGGTFGGGVSPATAR